MRRIALVLLAAVFIPSIVLGILALRAARQQREIVTRQMTELYQKDVDSLAGAFRNAIFRLQRDFTEQVRVGLGGSSPQALASNLPAKLGANLGGTAFAVSSEGDLVSPAGGDSHTMRFLRDHEEFLSNRSRATLFPAQQVLSNSFVAPRRPPEQEPAFSPSLQATSRNLVPQKNSITTSQSSSLVSDFRTAIGDARDGVLARYTQDGVEMILWTRPREGGGMLYGLVLPAPAIARFARETFASLAPRSSGACLALLDESAHPVAASIAGFSADWKHPFVAAEIGETLPHWEAGLYLTDPDRIVRSANLLALALTVLIAVTLSFILAGGVFVALDARQQLMLAQKKTDFVSNVSHELKTPLTSIRMFAEMLGIDGLPPEKRSHYLRIIGIESERLTRLIDNVLDFARFERNRKILRKSLTDLRIAISSVWDVQSAHLQENGFSCEWIADDGPYFALADADAIAQALMNLLSNAEKYSDSGREVTLRTKRASGFLLISVLDRGPGVPRGEESRIFQAFHRANDSLASGVQGSGIGLTLALRIARAHGGDVIYRPRDGGGSEFTLKLPLDDSAT